MGFNSGFKGLSIGYSRCKVVPLHAVKAYGGVVARFHSFLTSELDKSWGANFAPRPNVADKTALSTHGTERGRADTNRRYGHSGKHKNISPPYSESNYFLVVQHTA